jgi:hypothetical protein
VAARRVAWRRDLERGRDARGQVGRVPRSGTRRVQDKTRLRTEGPRRTRRSLSAVVKVARRSEIWPRASGRHVSAGHETVRPRRPDRDEPASPVAGHRLDWPPPGQSSASNSDISSETCRRLISCGRSAESLLLRNAKTAAAR